MDEERPDVSCTALLLRGQVTVTPNERVAVAKLRGLGSGDARLGPRLGAEALKGWGYNPCCKYTRG